MVGVPLLVTFFKRFYAILGKSSEKDPPRMRRDHRNTVEDPRIKNLALLIQRRIYLI